MLKEKALLKKRKAAHKAKSKREFGGARVLAGHPTRKNFMLSHTLLLLVQALSTSATLASAAYICMVSC